MSSYASACVLSFNRPRLVAASLRSLIDNADAPLELIVHDDGSRGQVLSLLHSYLASGEISTLIMNSPGNNQGQGVALNRMFGMATGDPILKLDHDLIYQPGWLSRVNRLMGIDEIGLLGLLHYWHEPVHSERTLLHQHAGWSAHTHILGSGFALKREVWEELGPFEEHSPAFAEDWDMQQRVAKSQWVCALPDGDLVENVGMGVGPSTVNVTHDQVQPIHYGPMVIGA